MGTQSSDSSTRFEDGAPVVATMPGEARAPVDSPAANTRLASTRAGRAWGRLLPALFLLAILLVFILQNLHRAKVSFLGVSGTMPLAVALLAAAVIGALFVLAVGSVRIVQLRRVIRRER